MPAKKKAAPKKAAPKKASLVKEPVCTKKEAVAESPDTENASVAVSIDAPEPKKKPAKKDASITLGPKCLDPKKDYNLTRSQRQAFTKKGQSLSTVPEEMTGKELTEILCKFKVSYISLGIKR